jgi:hypothetical protein
MAQYRMPFEESVYDTATGMTHSSISTTRQYLLSMVFSETWPDDQSGAIFNERQYFRKEGTQLFPSEAYSDYTIITNFNDPVY